MLRLDAASRRNFVLSVQPNGAKTVRKTSARVIDALNSMRGSMHESMTGDKRSLPSIVSSRPLPRDDADITLSM